MAGEKTKKRKILWIVTRGKWAEIWFEDGSRDPNHYDQSCKWYMLDDVIQSAGLDEYVMQHGHVGLWLEWVGDRPVNANKDTTHDSDCAVHRAPAYPAGPCNCQQGTIHDEPIVEFTIPGTLDVPSVTFGFNTVNRLPEKANPSAVVSYDGRLWIYSSKGWNPIPD